MFFRDKQVLVIGGTGTIGRRIVQSVLIENPRMIKVLSRDEYKQYQMQHEMENKDNLRFMIGDVRDYDRLVAAMQDIDYVFHLASMKHVSLCEANPFEAVQSNVQGTNNVIKAALAQNVKKVVFTSTDKAIAPTNAYGATKLIAERLFASVEQSGKKGTTVFSCVRFGNVMGSRGSVIPLFKEQIEKNKRVQITDREMTRFMMTLSQAANLTIQALKEAKGGEIFVLKMPVVKLADLVTILIEETCKKLKIAKDAVTVDIVGSRSGEKMYEELMTEDESKQAFELSDMYMIPGKFSNVNKYKNAKKAIVDTYSSQLQQPITLEQLRALLIKEGLV
ncbi:MULTISPECIES: SDR family NAD(P)-dependent oxidoreductase [Clostridia]|uniref:SDR family NAD(P)-dependent oxidoreductase n=1 Tax=Clostridia TaxID=186801 RepID=UPI000EA0B015|nr:MULTISPECIES: SDR family NAD(P)-dependent oxidoreductase [Clostridia]NBJ68068.1 SDR family NAD(P)-dependent oxidoreductase [Roseburia sp. 1XD42-34]RKI82509.1 SDR family NAD(P)-dependent oxidoreductase [Clostridium sp. 1xD42-85]